MISVTLYKNKNGGIYRFEVLNHGKDVVCAGVSALVITCVNFIQSRFNADTATKYDPDGGYIDFEVPAIKQGGTNEEIALAIDQMVFGLEQIRKVHKKEIKIKTVKD
jgi:hypothetical protein